MKQPDPAPLSGLAIDGRLEIVSDGTPGGTTISVDGKKLALVQSLAFRVTPEGVLVQLVALAAKATLVGRILSIERAEPPEQASAPATPAPAPAKKKRNGKD